MKISIFNAAEQKLSGIPVHVSKKNAPPKEHTAEEKKAIRIKELLKEF